MSLFNRETARLRFGRTSAQGAFYFVTACTKNREAVLTSPENGIRAASTLRAMHSSGDIDLAAATFMPDHVHLLFALGARLEVGQVMGKFKTLARDMGRSPWHWQQDGFEHRVRDHGTIEDYGFYIFMNPYQVGLCPLMARWPWWTCPEPSIFRFLKAIREQEAVPRSWLDLNEEIRGRIITGE